MQRSTPQATAGSAERTPARAAAPAARAGGGERANAPRAADLRVAYVGQAVYFGQCALESPAGGLDPVFLDFRAGAPADRLLDDLRTLDPDVVLVFRPEIVPPGLFASLRATTIGYLTEPLPRGRDGAHTDLRARLRWLEQVDRSNFDRIVSFDPLIAETASGVIDVWRAAPIPVADSLYMDVRARSTPPALLFVGRWTAHRDSLLAPAARGYPLMHIGHGLFGEPLRRVLAGADVQLNLHNNPYPTFENRVCIALAAGHLVISEPLSPSHGLVAGEHYLEAATPTE
ncbi:MAG: hypothetical protein KGJ43_03955, partial [Acidobacteriota bacterium]|nr:hypothetical protein [Acidobacteriota bacterium]